MAMTDEILLRIPRKTLCSLIRKGMDRRLVHRRPTMSSRNWTSAPPSWQAFTGKCAVLDGDGRSFDALAAERVPGPMIPAEAMEPCSAAEARGGP